MMFNVPQFIDVEDKVAGPLTWRQLLWMIGMGVLLLVLYNVVPGLAFIVIAIPVVLAFVALAFYRPHGQPLISFIGHGFFFFFRPKVAVWERPVVRMRTPVLREERAPVEETEKGVSRDKLRALAEALDQ